MVINTVKLRGLNIQISSYSKTLIQITDGILLTKYFLNGNSSTNP